MSTHVFRRAALVVIGAALVACATIAGIDDFRIGECKGGNCPDDGAAPPPPPPPDSAVPVADTGVACNGQSSPAAIRVGLAPNTFCIDTTEVTNADYKRFLDAKVALANQPPECAWNTTFEPARPAVPADAGPDAGPKLDDNAPVTHVDWCDARAYCVWSGKYLCGLVENGVKVGPVDEENLGNFQRNQWLSACSAGGVLRFPYGGVFIPTRCNVIDYAEGGVVPVTSTECVGGYVGLRDMVGNVGEWIDDCRLDAGAPDADAGHAADPCITKGGAFDDGNPGSTIGCGYEPPPVRRDRTAANLGFRCCSD